MIRKQPAALECPTFPVNPRELQVPEVCSAAILSCRTIHGTRWVFHSGNVFLKIYLVLEISMRHGEGLTREPQSSTISTPRFTRNPDTWNLMHRIERTYSQNCMMEAMRYVISELHLGKFPDPDGFQCWRVNLKTKVCKHVFPQLTTSWDQ